MVRNRLRPALPTDSVVFSIAFIALAAKLAKADGQVTRGEIAMFRHIFEIPPEETQNVARVYDLCRQETTGFETYARQMSSALARAADGDTLREDVLDGLFHIAMADGEFHPDEEVFLREVHRIFGLPDGVFRRLKARHVPEFHDPYSILGVPEDATPAQLRAARRNFLRENHPDRLVAKGLPREMVALAHARIADFNAAYDLLAGRDGIAGNSQD